MITFCNLHFTINLLSIVGVFSENENWGGVHPKTQVVVEGTKKVFIQCYSQERVRWTRSNGKSMPKTMVTENDLIFSNVKLRHADVYTCHGKFRDTPFKAKSELLVGGITFYIPLFFFS